MSEQVWYAYELSIQSEESIQTFVRELRKWTPFLLIANTLSPATAGLDTCWNRKDTFNDTDTEFRN